MQNKEQKQTLEKANKVQAILGDNLLNTPQHVSDIKQVIEIMTGLGQNISQEQLRAIILLNELGQNKLIHGEENPYEKLIKAIITDYKKAVTNPVFYLDTIEELVPKPPKPVVFAPSGKQVNLGRGNE